jgi:hypothetical protein
LSETSTGTTIKVVRHDGRRPSLLHLGTHPANLTLRFVLELSALFALGRWGWSQRGDGFRMLIGLGLPLAAAAAWGICAVPDDPTRSGSAPIPVPGLARLALESVFFGSAVGAFYALGLKAVAGSFAFTVAVHYLLSFDRIRWLVAQRAG